MISLITPTGFRSEALALCQKWMLQQTLPFDEWIIVDDSGEVEITGDPRIKVFQNPHKAENTQADSLLIGLSHASGDRIFVIEDDDYYAPDYLQWMSDTMEAHNLDLLGEGPAHYYHVEKQRYKNLNNSSYSCLCQTAMNKRVAKLLLGIVAAQLVPIDWCLWSAATRSTNLRRMVLATNLVVGIKGMPGRKHSGFSWDPARAAGWEQDDKNLTKLRELVTREEDFNCYKALIERL